MGKKCSVCGGKIAFMVDINLSENHYGTYICNACDNLLDDVRKGDINSLAKLKNKISQEAKEEVREYIESLGNLTNSTIVKETSDNKASTNQIIEVSEDEFIGISRKDAISKVKMCDGETLIKTYHCSTMSCPWVKGYLLVTNKRVIYSGLGKKSCFINETNIDNISGINIMYGKRVNLTKLLFGLLLAILSIICFVYSRQVLVKALLTFGSLALLATGLILIITSIKKCFKLTIHTSKAMATPINVNTSKHDLNNVIFSLSANPTKETDKMIFELGALIHDLQTMGDIAIDKWKN